jgi:hypothetical protein
MSWWNPFSWGDSTPNPNQGENTTPQAGAAGSYTSNPDSLGYGGQAEIMGNGNVNTTDINLPNYLKNQSMLQQTLAGGSPYATNGYNNTAANQQISTLGNMAAGVGPSVAQQQYNQTMGQGAAALAGAAHGGSSPAAFRSAATQMGQLTEGSAAGAAQARTQEQMSANQALTGALSSQGQMNNQVNQFNAGAYGGYLGQYLGLSQEQLQALMSDQSAKLGYQNAANQQAAAQDSAFAGVLGAGASLAKGI